MDDVEQWAHERSRLLSVVIPGVLLFTVDAVLLELKGVFRNGQPMSFVNPSFN